MAALAGFKITGAVALDQTLRALGGKTATKIGKAAMRRAAKPTVKTAKSRVPVDSGLTKMAIGARVYSSRKREAVIAAVGAKSSVKGKKASKIRLGGGRLSKANPANTIHLVELGSHKTPAGWRVTPRRSPVLFIDAPRTGDETGFARAVWHAGFQAQPFLRPALLANRGSFVRILKKELWLGIKKEIRKSAVKKIKRTARVF